MATSTIQQVRVTFADGREVDLVPAGDLVVYQDLSIRAPARVVGAAAGIAELEPGPLAFTNLALVTRKGGG